MSALADGVLARRAVIRWAVRMFRREWRQQLLVLALLTFAVAAAVYGATLAYNATASQDGAFGRADHRLTVAAPDQAALQAALTALRPQLGVHDEVQQRVASVPGAVESLEVRAEKPGGVYDAPMLALRAGRYPTAAGEIALTDRAAQLLDTRLGATVMFDGRDRVVVGMVENPGDLHDEFVLVDPAHADPPTSVTLLVRWTDAQVPNRIDRGHTLDRSGVVTRDERRGGNERATAALIVLVMATVAMMLVALVAAAGFLVLAQRRLRQLGMLASIGATDRHLRLVVLANGLLVGAVAAIVGVATAVIGWMASAPALEDAFGHRIDRFSLPLGVLAGGAVLAVLTAAAAAWWPARAMARVPVVEALSARPPRPRVARRSLVAAVVLLVAGFVAVDAGIDSRTGHATVPLFIGGMVAVAAGVLFLCPLAIRALARTAGRLPVALRLALRDLGRNQARSGAALAAISLALGIAVGVVVIARSQENGAAAGNLAGRQVLVRANGKQSDGGPQARRSAAELAQLDAQVARMRDALGARALVPLDSPMVRVAAAAALAGQGVKGGSVRVTVGPPAQGGQSADTALAPVILGHPLAGTGRGRGYSFGDRVYVGTPAVLAYLGIDAGSIHNEVISPIGGAAAFLDPFDEPVDMRPQVIKTTDYTSLPRTLVTPDAVTRHGWEVARAAWLLETNGAPSTAALQQVRHLAAEVGLVVETRDTQGGLATTRTVALAAGALLALGILAMTVGLIRGEAAADLRTLTAAGATSAIRRGLTGATSGALALLGSGLGVAGAYVVLVAAYASQLHKLRAIPYVDLAVILLALPAAAALLGFVLSGREPSAIATKPVFE